MTHKRDSAPFRNFLTSIFLIVFLFSPSEKPPVFGQSITQQDQTILPSSDFNPCIRILSIDGGGVRGIIPAAVLERIEEETGEPVSRLFDFISGTSTGAVISLALTKPSEKDSQKAQFSAKDIVGFYERDSRILFPPPSTETEENRFLTSTKYSPEPPLNIFRQTFGKTGLKKSLVPILVPTYNIKEKKPFFFKSWVKSTNDYPMSEVARAAVAAPGYFPPVELPAHRQTSSPKQTMVLVDGGVFANNPMRYALENSYQLGNIRKGIFLLSLGTGKTSPEHPRESPYHWEEAQWPSPLKNLLFADPPISNQESSSQITLRMEPVIPAENAAMDNAREQNLLTLRNISKQMMNQNRPAFKRILRILKTPRPAGCFREGNLPD